MTPEEKDAEEINREFNRNDIKNTPGKGSNQHISHVEYFETASLIVPFPETPEGIVC